MGGAVGSPKPSMKRVLCMCSSNARWVCVADYKADGSDLTPIGFVWGVPSWPHFSSWNSGIFAVNTGLRGP